MKKLVCGVELSMDDGAKVGVPRIVWGNFSPRKWWEVGSGSIGASSDLNQSSRTISPKTMRCTEVRWNGGAEETEQ